MSLTAERQTSGETMRTFLGFAQLGLGIWGLVGLLNGSWMTTIVAWGLLLVVSIIGVRLTKFTNGGVSDMAGDAASAMYRAGEALRNSDLSAARTHSQTAINALRIGGDKDMLPMALTMRAVALGGSGRWGEAKQDMGECRTILNRMDVAKRSYISELDEVFDTVEREVRNPSPSSVRLVAAFNRLNSDD